MSALLTLLALAGADPLLDALEAEAERTTTELSLGDSDPPYYVGFDLIDGFDSSVTAALGGVVGRSEGPARTLGVAVRVGSPEVDSANFDDSFSGDGFRSRGATVGDDPWALRHTAWYEVDTAYKEALENLARREAARARMAKPPKAPCFAPGEPTVAELDPSEPIPRSELEPLAIALSEVFLDRPEIEWSRVFATTRSGRRALVDTEGTRVSKPRAMVVVRAVGRVRAEDGTWITDQVSWVVRRMEDLPALDELRAETEAMADRLEAWAATEQAEDDYVGPVLFEGDAAIDLVEALVLPALKGTPGKETAPKGSRTVMVDFDDEGGSTVRVKRRLMPSGFHVSDDPTADLSLPSGYRYDDEGVPAQAIDLVVDGVIRTHYASRTPSEEVPASNGHARGAADTLKRGVAAFTRVEADRRLSARKLHKTALDLADDYDLDHYVVVRRVEDRMAADVANPVRFRFGGDEEGPLAAPVEAVRVYADGREEPVRGWTFVGVDHRLLRDLAAASNQTHQQTGLAPIPDSWSGGVTGGLPTTVSTPDLLIGEVELSATGANGEKPPALPSPLAEAD